MTSLEAGLQGENHYDRTRLKVTDPERQFNWLNTGYGDCGFKSRSLEFFLGDAVANTMTVIYQLNLGIVRWVELDIMGKHQIFICLQWPWWDLRDCIMRAKCWRVK